jgi:hypothetical protein
LTVEDTRTSAAPAWCATRAAMWTATPATSSPLTSISPGGGPPVDRAFHRRRKQDPHRSLVRSSKVRKLSPPGLWPKRSTADGWSGRREEVATSDRPSPVFGGPDDVRKNRRAPGRPGGGAGRNSSISSRSASLFPTKIRLSRRATYDGAWSVLHRQRAAFRHEVAAAIQHEVGAWTAGSNGRTSENTNISIASSTGSVAWPRAATAPQTILHGRALASCPPRRLDRRGGVPHLRGILRGSLALGPPRIAAVE